MTDITLVGGDIVEVEADALITAVSSTGPWDGAIDSAIRAVTHAGGEMFHEQLAAKRPFSDGDLLHITASHNGAFDSVLFMVDDLLRPLDELVLGALAEAEWRGSESVSLPAFRTGFTGEVFETREQAMLGLLNGIGRFLRIPHKDLQKITVVVPNREHLAFLSRQTWPIDQVTT